MKKIELLSPVGNKEMLYYAIHSGADAIYLSGKNYGARKFANNFTNEELKDAINYAHTYGVKAYITINTLIYEEEINEVLKYIEFLYINQVDALIMQDIGLIKTVKETFPNLEIHASTQCHNHNQETIDFYKELGAKRVVLAREMTLNEINNLKTNLELEVFIHGALCICYSGCCLFSSLNGGRSGNRGECVGSCRLPYTLIKNNTKVKTEGNYLLSTKELNTTTNLKELLESNITSLKIEGRMKSPEYVGYVTKIYRTLIDKYYNNEEMTITKNELTNLKKLYNRNFTKGYLFNEENITNLKTPNHQGIPIGKVLSLTKDKIKIKVLSDYLSQNDGIRFKESNKGLIVNKLYNEKNKLVNHINKGEIAYLDNTKNITTKDTILKTFDYQLSNQIKSLQLKKIPINLELIAKTNKPLTLTISDNKHKITLKGAPVEHSRTRPTTYKEIENQLKRLGNTPYKEENIKIIKDDPIFINIKDINELRRKAVETLTKARIKISIPLPKRIYKPIINYLKDNTIHINALARTKDQLQACLNNQIDTIYLTDYKLYNTYKDNPNIYYRTPRVNTTYKKHIQENLLITEIGSLKTYIKDNTLIGDYYLNVTNTNTINYLLSKGLKRVTLSVELTDKQIKTIMHKPYPVELIIYGYPELMITKHCLLKTNINYCKTCQNLTNKFYLKDKDNNKYKLLKENCLTHIMDYKPINKINNLSYFKELNINNFRIELLEENYNEVDTLIKKIKKEVQKCQK